jgi:hypothetical protein
VESKRFGGWYQDAFVLCLLALIATAREEDAEARERAQRALELGHGAGDPQVVVTVLAHVALVEAELGDIDSARSHALVSLQAHLRFPMAGSGRADALLAPVAAELGIERELRARVEAAPPEDLWAPAIRAMVDGEYRTAADLYCELAVRPREVVDALERCLPREGAVWSEAIV